MSEKRETKQAEIPRSKYYSFEAFLKYIGNSPKGLFTEVCSIEGLNYPKRLHKDLSAPLYELTRQIQNSSILKSSIQEYKAFEEPELIPLSTFWSYVDPYNYSTQYMWRVNKNLSSLEAALSIVYALGVYNVTESPELGSIKYIDETRKSGLMNIYTFLKYNSKGDELPNRIDSKLDKNIKGLFYELSYSENDLMLFENTLNKYAENNILCYSPLQHIVPSEPTIPFIQFK